MKYSSDKSNQIKKMVLIFGYNLRKMIKELDNSLFIRINLKKIFITKNIFESYKYFLKFQIFILFILVLVRLIYGIL